MNVTTGERRSHLDDFSFEAVLRRLDQASDATASTSRNGRDEIERVIQDAFDALDRCGAHLRRRMEGEVLKRIQMQLKNARSRDGERLRRNDDGCDRVGDVLYYMRRMVHSHQCSPGARVNCARVVAEATIGGILDSTDWQSIIDCIPSTPVTADSILAMASPNARVGVGSRDWALTIGAAAASFAKGDMEMTRELFGLIDGKLRGGVGARVVGLTLLHAAIAVEDFITSDDLVLAVHKALTAVSSCPIENGFACISAGMRCVYAAARSLSLQDVSTLRTSWLQPRLEAQGFKWSKTSENDHALKLSLVEYLKIPRDERLEVTAMTAFLIADLHLVGYVDAEGFRQMVVHGVVDLESPSFQALNSTERALGQTVASAVIATQMNLIHTLYVAPGHEHDGDDEVKIKIALEGSKILCGKALDLLRLERNNAISLPGNAASKVEELTTDVHSSSLLGVMSYALTTESIEIEEKERHRLVAWCCEKLRGRFVTAPDSSLRATVNSGCIQAMLHLLESSEDVKMRNTCISGLCVLIDLCSVPETLYKLIELLAFKTPSLELLGAENRDEDSRRTAYVIAAMHWVISRLKASSDLAQAQETLNLFRRLFILLPRCEFQTWMVHFTNAYAGAALWVGQIEKDVLIDTERVLADATARKHVESFDSRDDIGEVRLEWLKNLHVRSSWLEEAFQSLLHDPLLAAHFTLDLVVIMSKSVDMGTKGAANESFDASFWPYKSENPLVHPQAPLGPGGILATSASALKFILEQLDSRYSGGLGAKTLEESRDELKGLLNMTKYTLQAVNAAGKAIKSPGGVSVGRVAHVGAKTLISVAKNLTKVVLAVRSSEFPEKNMEKELIALTKELLQTSDEVEQSKTLEAAPGCHRRRFAAGRAALLRAINLAEVPTEEVKFELTKIRRRRRSKRESEKRERIPPKPRLTPFAREAEPDDFIDEDGVSILEAFEPSTDEDSDSEDNDDDAFVMRGMD